MEIYEEILKHNKLQGKNFAHLERNLYGGITNNLSSKLKHNKTMIPTLEKVFDELGVVLVSEKELIELRALKNKNGD